MRIISAEAIASPIEEATEKLAVGTMPNGSASFVTDASKTASTISASLLFGFPKIPTIFAFLFLNTGSSEMSSGVDPLFDKNITGSPT